MSELLSFLERVVSGDAIDFIYEEVKRVQEENNRLRKLLEDKSEQGKIPSKSEEFDLDKIAWEQIKLAASESEWIPEEYSADEWVADVCDFLKEKR